MNFEKIIQIANNLLGKSCNLQTSGMRILANEFVHFYTSASFFNSRGDWLYCNSLIFESHWQILPEIWQTIKMIRYWKRNFSKVQCSIKHFIYLHVFASISSKVQSIDRRTLVHFTIYFTILFHQTVARNVTLFSDVCAEIFSTFFHFQHFCLLKQNWDCFFLKDECSQQGSQPQGSEDWEENERAHFKSKQKQRKETAREKFHKFVRKSHPFYLSYSRTPFITTSVGISEMTFLASGTEQAYTTPRLISWGW